MKIFKFPIALLLFLFLMSLPPAGYAQPVQGGREGVQGFEPGVLKERRTILTTKKGLFNVTMVMDAEEFGVNTHTCNLIILDKEKKGLAGAEITVTPWMPEHGHGVLTKPVVKDLGEGNYLVDNVFLLMNGRWELTVAVRKGDREDRAVFKVAVVGRDQKSEEAVREKEAPGKYERSVSIYKVPDVTLLNQSGEKIGLSALLNQDKPVIIDFIFTTCTTICPILSAAYANLQEELGAASGTVQLVSISIDPEHDQPEQMKQYLQRYDAKAGWDFLTGSQSDITLVMKAFDAYVSDKMSHLFLYLLRGPNSGEWVRIVGDIGMTDLRQELGRVQKK